MEDKFMKEHSSTLRDYFFQLYKDQSLCDVSFITKTGTTILAHKLIVSAFSGAVRAEVNRWKDLHQVSILVDCEDNILKGILEFVYTGSVTIDDKLIPSLLDACHGLQIPTLQLYLTEKASKRKKIKHRYNPVLPLETNLDNEVPKVIDEIENDVSESSGIEVSKKSRERRRKKALDDEILWSDDNESIILDDKSEDDETWYPSDQERTVTMVTASTKSSNYSKNLKHAYVKLERINVNKVSRAEKRSAMLNSSVESSSTGKHKKDWYTRENLTRLAKTKHKHCLKKKKFLLKMKTQLLKNFSTLSSKRNLSVMAAGKISQNCKKFSYLEVNKTGYTCRICKYWNKFFSVVTLHINTKHKAKKTLKIKAVSKVKVKRMSKKRKKIERIKKKIENFECFKCDRKYKQMRGLATHLTEKHKYSAERTQKLTGYPKYFSFQKKINTECDLCGEKFSNLNDYRAHCRGVHRKRRLDPDIPCTFGDCQEKFHTTKAMKEHLEEFHQYKDTKRLTFRKVVNSKCLQKQTKVLKDLAVEEQKLKTQETSTEPVSLDKCYEGRKGKGEKKSTCLRKNNFRHKIFLPSKKFRCNKCSKPTVCHHKTLHTKHTEIDHMNIRVSKLYQSKLVLSKALQFIKPVVNNDVDGGLKRHDNYDTINSVGGYGDSAETTEHQNKNEKFGTEYALTTGYNIKNETWSTERLLFGSDDLSQLQQYYTNGMETIDHVDKSLSSALITDIGINSDGEHQFSSDQIPISLSSQNSKKRGDNQYKCWKCNKSFIYYSLLVRHVRSKHIKFHLRQKSIFRKIQKHVMTRKKVFTRKSLVPTISRNVERKMCIICDKTFTHSRYLVSHFQTKHLYSLEEARFASGYGITNPKTVKCIDCDDSFTSIRGLASHLQTRHRYTFEQAREATGYPSRQSAFLPPQPTTCKQCSETFPSRKKCREHQLSAHGVDCQYCKKFFRSLFDLKRHGMKIHIDKFDEFKSIIVPKFDEGGNEKPVGNIAEKVFRCEKCEYSTNRIQDLTGHIIDLHPEVQYPCSVCGFSFRNTESRDKHIVKHHGDNAEKKKSVCEWCEKKFLRPCFLRVHAFKVHGIPHASIKEYKCEYKGCRKITYTKQDRTNHIYNTHKAVRKFPCQHCDYVSPTRHRLLRHVRCSHLKLKPYLCETCGKAFSEDHHMKDHIKRFHTHDYYQIQCEYCPYQCGYKNQLHVHTWAQHKIKMEDDFRVYYQCDICGFICPEKRTFTNHVNSHNNIRNYACDQCGKTFITPSTMASHKKWKHTSGNDDKACDQCDYKTKTRQKLNEHIRIQHQLKGIKPYRCPYCEFTCASGGNCRKHIMGKHKGEVVRYECDKEFLEVAKMARKEGNTNPLIVQVENVTSFEPITQQVDLAQVTDPNYQEIESTESNFNQHFI